MQLFPVDQVVEHQPINLEDKIFHMFVPTSAYTLGAELSYLSFSWEGNSKTAQPLCCIIVPMHTNELYTKSYVLWLDLGGLVPALMQT